MFQRIQDFLKTPSYMQLSLRYNSSVAITWGIVVSLMVYLFLWNVDGLHKNSDILICGLVAILVFGLNMGILPMLFPNFFDADRWSMRHDLLFSAWLLLMIGGSTLLVLRYLDWIDFQWAGFLVQEFFILIVGLPAMTVLVVLRNQQYQQQPLKAAVKINQLLLSGPRASLRLKAAPLLLDTTSPEPQTAQRPKPKESTKTAPSINFQDLSGTLISIPATDLLALHSEKGTLHIYWVKEEELQYHSIPLQLKFVGERVAEFNSFILQCHRFFWINALRVEEVQSDARSIALKMPGIPNPIPVSKSHLKKIKSYFKA